jgi:predicted RNase H-like HicB family nuclease
MKQFFLYDIIREGGINGMSKELEFSVVIEKDEDGYFVASVPALRGCHTQAKSLDLLMKRVKEAIELCLEVEEPAVTEFIGVQRVAVTA